MTSYLLSGPAAEPVTLAEARTFLRLDDTGEDALVTTLIAAARLHVESVTGRALLAQSWRLVLDDWPLARLICLPIGPMIGLTSITAYTAAGEAAALSLTEVMRDATANPPLLFLPPGFGASPLLRPRQGIEIDYVAGFGSDAADVPASLRQAVLALVAHWFENRDAMIVAGAGAVVPSGFDLLVGPYRRVRL